EFVSLAWERHWTPTYAHVNTIQPDDAVDADMKTTGLTGKYDAPASPAPTATDAPVSNDIDGDLAQPGQVDQGTSYDDALDDNSYNQNGWNQNGTQNGTVAANPTQNTATPVYEGTNYQEDHLFCEPAGGVGLRPG